MILYLGVCLELNGFWNIWYCGYVLNYLVFSAVRAEDAAEVVDDIGKSRDGSRTDDEVVQR